MQRKSMFHHDMIKVKASNIVDKLLSFLNLNLPGIFGGIPLPLTIWDDQPDGNGRYIFPRILPSSKLI